MPSLWPEQCPKNLHKAAQTSDGTTEKRGNPEPDIPGRLVTNGGVKGGTGATDLTLLRLLGFMINWEKSHLTPTQVITYLGFLIDLTNMTLTLPEEKVQRIISDCQAAALRGEVSVRELSKLIGRMSVTMLAVLPAPLCYRGLQALKNRVFAASQSMETVVSLTREATMELWWC